MDTEYIPDELLEAFDNIDDLPRYEINNKLFDMTEYPDFIHYHDLSHPIMIGVDRYKRTFIVFKFKFVTPKITHYITSVLFQRYTNDPYWVTASNPAGIYNIMGDGAVNSSHIKILKQILKDKRLNNVTNVYTKETGDYILG